MTKMCNKKAWEFINYWKDWQKYAPRVFKDTELTDADMKKYSLVLYGDANSNLITKKLSDKIPLKVSTQDIEIAGRKFPAKDACVQMIYPHPLNTERYITVIGATSGAGMFFYNRADSYCDFFIQDGIILNNRIGRTEKLLIATGFFDNNWQINDKLTEVGDPELRKISPIRKVLPDLTTTIENVPAIDSTVIKSLVGKYEIQPGINVNIFIDNGNLMGNTPEGLKFHLFPYSETEHFIDIADIQLTFIKNENGKITGVVVHQPGRDMEMKKIE
jgi:hypothetical protein